MPHILIVGAGFAGSVIARELAEAGLSVQLIDRRSHIGGNAYDFENAHEERIHAYGPHLLHGEHNSKAIRWLSRFTDWTPYEHKVRALLPNGRTTPLPVNRTTLEDVFGVNLEGEAETKALLNAQRVNITPHNTDEVFLANVGPKLADLFFRPYTRKMWGLEPTELEAAVGARLPVRYSRDDRYFTDSFQAMPSKGYTAMFQNILAHQNIQVSLNQSYEKSLSEHFDHTFLSAPIDEYFDHRHGKLPYRSIRFEHFEQVETQEATVINFTDTGIYTRATQWDLIANSKRRTDGMHTVTREIPCNPEDNKKERYYPIRNSESLAIYERYQEEASRLSRLTFIGRTGLFRYIDMVPCVTIHLKIAAEFIRRQKHDAQTLSREDFH